MAPLDSPVHLLLALLSGHVPVLHRVVDLPAHLLDHSDRLSEVLGFGHGLLIPVLLGLGDGHVPAGHA